MPFPTELNLIADMLETTLPAHLEEHGGRFNMNVFRHDEPGGRGGRAGPDCGTEACAAGWASILLPRLGLTSRPGDGELYYRLSAEQAKTLGYMPPGGAVRGFMAVAFACDIEFGQATRLFTHDQSHVPALVAQNIRKFVAEEEVRRASS